VLTGSRAYGSVGTLKQHNPLMPPDLQVLPSPRA
jgi:hypothetical protein